MKQVYVTALVDSILKGLDIETALLNTKAVLKKRGHLRLWSQILKAAKRELESRLMANTPQVVVAGEGKVSEEKIKAALIALGANVESYNKTVDSTLIGGFKASFKHQVVDASYKKTLVELYRQIIKP
jgi:F0F1-type ATP synthase delta subunit